MGLTLVAPWINSFVRRVEKSLRSAKHQALISALVKARKDAGLTQQQLADKLGQNQSFVAKYETGERRLDVVEFLAIVSATESDLIAVIAEVQAA